MTIKTYSELSLLTSYEDRLSYLKLDGSVGQETFGFDRYINQKFYRSREWKSTRDFVIVRDNGCDLGIEDRPISSGLLVHHMNPIFSEEIVNAVDSILDPEYLITTTHNTHNYIHYGIPHKTPKVALTRSVGDTTLW